VRQVIRLARELGEAFRVRAVRLDSGDLLVLAKAVRRLLDEAGLERVQIVASGGLDEDEIARLLAAGAPIDGFGVGSRMAVSADAPYLDLAYKLVEYAGGGRIKLSPGKATLPGRKQVFRLSRGGEDVADVLGLAGEDPHEAAREVEEGLEARSVLVPVMRHGRRLAAGKDTLAIARERAREAVSRLPAPVRELGPADPPYAVRTSRALARAARGAEREMLTARPSR
jgi:nicotinate phosphoribosyltransferase